MTYVPNGTRSRLEWVLQTHRKRPVVPFEVAVIVLFAIGYDRTAEDMGCVEYDVHGYDDPNLEDSFAGWWLQLLTRTSCVRRPLRDDDAEEAVRLVDDDRREVDAIIPWLAKVVSTLVRAVDRAAADYMHAELRHEPEEELKRKVRAFQRGQNELAAKGAAIAMMVADERVNLSGMSLSDVLERLRHYTPRRQVAVQGQVVFRWDDGWTIQKLGPEALRSEGEIMQHCVGSYCEMVESGEADIFSLRDPKGMPHATMEFDEDGALVQVQGKQNDAPKDEYADRVGGWIASWGVDDPNTLDALLHLAGNVPSQRDAVLAWIANTDLERADPERHLKALSRLGVVDFQDKDFRGFQNTDALTLHFSDFDGADFTGAKLLRVHLVDCFFNNATLDDARLRVCYFRANKFRRASMLRLVAEDSAFHDCNFADADLSYSTFDECNFTGASFARIASANGAYFVGCNFFDAQLSPRLLREASFEFRTALEEKAFEEAVARSRGLEEE